jgi:hypothetical protein
LEFNLLQAITCLNDVAPLTRQLGLKHLLDLFGI